MAGIELFFAGIMAGASGLGSGLPFAAWSRTRDPRFLLVTGSSVSMLALGLTWTWGQLPLNPPSYAASTLAPILMGCAASLLLLSTGLLPRRSPSP